MQKILLLLIITSFTICSTFVNSAGSNLIGKSGLKLGQTDDEYDRYKKRADIFFEQGDYLNALRQYRNCLEVPNYENDPYAKSRIELVQKLLKLRELANKSLNEGKQSDAVGLFEQILIENPKDSITKVNLTDYWTGEATKFYEQQKYEEAKVRYEKALQYATKPSLIQMQIQNSEAFIKIKADQITKSTEISKGGNVNKTDTLAKETQKAGTDVAPTKNVKPQKVTVKNHRTGTKLLVGAVGLGAGVYALMLNNQYQSKLDEVNRIGNMVDPDGDNIVLAPGEYSQWQTAYNETMDSKRNRSKFVASLGIVGVAALTEVILLALPKSKKTSGISIESSTQNLGLAVRYTFK